MAQVRIVRHRLAGTIPQTDLGAAVRLSAPKSGAFGVPARVVRKARRAHCL